MRTSTSNGHSGKGPSTWHRHTSWGQEIGNTHSSPESVPSPSTAEGITTATSSSDSMVATVAVRGVVVLMAGVFNAIFLILSTMIGLYPTASGKPFGQFRVVCVWKGSRHLKHLSLSRSSFHSSSVNAGRRVLVPVGALDPRVVEESVVGRRSSGLQGLFEARSEDSI